MVELVGGGSDPAACAAGLFSIVFMISILVHISIVFIVSTFSVFPWSIYVPLIVPPKQVNVNKVINCILHLEAQ